MYSHLIAHRLDTEPRTRVEQDPSEYGDGEGWQRLLHDRQDQEGQAEADEDGNKAGHDGVPVVSGGGLSDQHAVEDEVSESKFHSLLVRLLGGEGVLWEGRGCGVGGRPGVWCFGEKGGVVLCRCGGAFTSLCYTWSGICCCGGPDTLLPLLLLRGLYVTGSPSAIVMLHMMVLREG